MIEACNSGKGEPPLGAARDEAKKDLEIDVG